MLRCTASLVIATYAKVRLIPRYLCALPLALFTGSSKYVFFDFLQFNKFDLYISR